MTTGSKAACVMSDAATDDEQESQAGGLQASSVAPHKKRVTFAERDSFHEGETSPYRKLYLGQARGRAVTMAVTIPGARDCLLEEDHGGSRRGRSSSSSGSASGPRTVVKYEVHVQGYEQHPPPSHGLVTVGSYDETLDGRRGSSEEGEQVAAQWSAFRRFSEFATLRSNLATKYPEHRSRLPPNSRPARE